ncbi:terpene cyclase [Kitasatospora sp. NPDC002227]|uniref:terpene synthase family protein n=1 Tax=Kitasatospora sp. NPDC002227 TaxID=3154773 RepID=UPI00331D5B0A
MSDDTYLELPFPHRRSQHHPLAAQHHREWLQRHRDLAAGTADLDYAHWEIAELAALSYPDCSPADLGLAADLLGFYFLFDDQFDGPLGRHPRRIARLCDKLGAILHGARPDGTSPVERAFADLWRRSQQGMSARWRARTAYDWEWYFASHAAEAAGRNSGQLPDRQGYLMLRRGTAAMETVFDMVERLGRFEVPQAVLHHPLLRQMRQLAADIPSLTNDVRSFPLEAPRGDVCNLVLIAQRERACSVEEAGAVVLDEAQRMADRFFELKAELPDAYEWLELDPADRATAQRYADGLASWLAGYLHWERNTGRYRVA